MNQQPRDAKGRTPSESGTQNLMEDFGVKRTYDEPAIPGTEVAVPQAPQAEESIPLPPPAKEKAPLTPPPEEKPAPKKKAPAKKKSASTGKNKKIKNHSERDMAEASTAQKPMAKGAKKGKPDTVNLEAPRSARPAHKVIPYVLGLSALFLLVILVANLFCNPGNRLENDPSQHWIGPVGYYICYGLFGLFGPAAFAIPFLLANHALFWKKYIDSRLTVVKTLLALGFLLSASALIHIFCLCNLPADHRVLSSGELLYYGAQMTGGGFFGGHIGAFLYQYLNLAGSLILAFCLLFLFLFGFLGMTPQYLWKKYRLGRTLKAVRAPSLSMQNAEAARNKAEMEEKIRRSQGGQLSTDDMAAPPEGAVTVTEPARKKADKLAPMPIPHLDPTDGSAPFVPTGVNKKMEQGTTEEALKAPAPSPATATAATPAKPQNIAQNKDTAVDPIFPRTGENKPQMRRIPKADRNFDLKKVFIDFEDEAAPKRPSHSPLPPEVPMAGNMQKRPAATQGTNPAVRPQAPGTRPAPQGAGARPVPSVGAVRPKPAAAAGASAAQKPIFRKATPEPQELGMKDEQFEALEATQNAKAKAKGTAPATATAPKKPLAKPAAAKSAAPAAPKAPAKKKYTFPPISYLHPAEPMTEDNMAEIEENMNILADTFASFNVRIKEINYSCGPTVTRYEVTPAPGVRVRSIVNLSDDIALAMAAGGVRIEAPVPNKNAVGIEIPNKTRATVYLRELLETKTFAESKSKLTSGLGSDITGKPLLFNIADMPHLLVAGTTGSGKSVCINCIVMSLLYKATPEDVRLVMIDPKKVEFSVYKNIPHLMAPIVTTPKDAAGALQASVEEMESRYELLKEVGVRNVKEYNALTADDPDMPHLPCIVIIIDELADLMMTAPDAVETAICRIAQKGRAAGVHLIVGTQRPSVDVVTGLIKANIPSRIAFTVASQTDSRTILDQMGAEKLTGKGDMLFSPIGSLKPARVQGAFVADPEVEKICEFLRATNGPANYDEKFIAKLKQLAAECMSKGKGGADHALSEGGGDKSDDAKYADAVRIAIENKKISTSLLQRMLEIGYGRAAKLIDRMQREGIVSAPDGAKPRTILISTEEYLDRFVNNLSEGEEGKK